MRLRTRLLLVVVGFAAVSMVLLGGAVVAVQRATYLDQVRLRAGAFLSVVAANSVRDLAANRIEDLDRTVSGLLERDLAEWDLLMVAIVDQDRRVVAHTRQELYGTVLDDEFTVEAASTDAPLVRESPDGETLLASRPIVTAVAGKPGIRWGTAIAAFGLGRVRANLVEMLQVAIGAVVLAMLLSAGPVLWLLHSHMVRPVRRLAEAARAFAAGDLSRRAEVDRRDEVGDLSAGFNELADRVERHTLDLKEQIRARTCELEAANRELAEANERLLGLATTDGLTELHNFRHFIATIHSEVQRSRRTHQPLSMLMIDVDHFKAFNDTYGHPAGDEVLKGVARLILSRVRRTDMACRYGGEEFTIILVETRKNEALIVAEELRALVEGARFCGGDGSPSMQVTVSIGVATFPDDAEDAETLIKAADGAMYRAKQGGRNRVEAAGRTALAVDGQR